MATKVPSRTAATVDYLFGYDATAHVMSDWMYEQLSASLCAGPGEPQVHVRVQSVGAARDGGATVGGGGRGMWAQPEADTPDGLRQVLLETEGDLEGCGVSRCLRVPTTFTVMALTFGRCRQSRIHPADHLHQGRPGQTDGHLGGAGRGPASVITQGKSWKVKRIRNTPRVTVAICDRGGKPKSEAVEATAAIPDQSRSAASTTRSGRGMDCSERRSTSSPSCAVA